MTDQAEWRDPAERARVEALGTTELGCRYATRLVDRLERRYRGEPDVDDRDDPDAWIDLMPEHSLTDVEYFELILAALDATDGRRGATFIIADMWIDILRQRNPAVAARFRDERTRRPSVQLAFDEMRTELNTIGETDPFWLDSTGH